MQRMRLSAALLLAASAIAEESRTPVLIELFTSEGCSSCPPADALLRAIRTQQPFPGVELITLSEHVDYWDYIGWKDPNSSPVYTSRQRGYGESYTPQMIVDGQRQFVGSDRRALERAVADAAKAPKLPVRLALNGRRFSIALAELPRNADVFLAITEDNVASSVDRGENQGRRLVHDSVVRQWRALGKAKASLEVELAESTGDAAVVFVQDRSSRHVLGAASVRLR